MSDLEETAQSGLNTAQSGLHTAQSGLIKDQSGLQTTPSAWQADESEHAENLTDPDDNSPHFEEGEAELEEPRDFDSDDFQYSNEPHPNDNRGN